MLNDWNKKHSVPVDQYTKDGQFIASYESINDAVRGLLGVYVSCKIAQKANPNISKAVNGFYKTAYGYVWRFKGEEFLGVV